MPNIRPLMNKPLVEAIFEIRWEIPEATGDPRYSLFVGRLYDRVRSEYPFHQELPTSMIPSQVANNLVQHRFRTKEEKWPLVQIGPGVVTLNDTDNYTWGDFGNRARRLVNAIYDAYPEAALFNISAMNLRYIDAFELEDENMVNFLEDNLQTIIHLPPTLLDNKSIETTPFAVGLNVAFTCSNPLGRIRVKINSGKHNERPAIIMELGIFSSKPEIPVMPSGFREWIESAHNINDEWFFTFIEGELERKYAGE
ncbi:MAG: TIGR04255 family protein [Dehalococcoidales bacterium]|nr:TIGR04255 family protein [Dehalococcoidales bacterium]